MSPEWRFRIARNTQQADLNMEQCAEFMARMIQKYGAEILEELESENTQILDEKQT